MSKNILALVKLGNKEHLEQFRDRGLLYMKLLADFRDLECDAVRGDRFEGCDHVVQPRDIGELSFANPLTGQFAVPPSELAGPVIIRLDRTASCNVYCMSAITGPIDEGFDPRLLAFPDTDSLVVVLNPSEFVRRVFLVANEQKLLGKCGLVTYYDPEKYSGDTGAFSKPDTFAWQQEFRLAVWPGTAEPRLLSAGNLVDITSEIVPLSEANARFDFSTRSAQEAGIRP